MHKQLFFIPPLKKIPLKWKAQEGIFTIEYIKSGLNSEARSTFHKIVLATTMHIYHPCQIFSSM